MDRWHNREWQGHCRRLMFQRNRSLRFGENARCKLDVKGVRVSNFSPPIWGSGRIEHGLEVGTAQKARETWEPRYIKLQVKVLSTPKQLGRLRMRCGAIRTGVWEQPCRSAKTTWQARCTDNLQGCGVRKRR